MFSSTLEVMHQYFRDYPESIERQFRDVGLSSFPAVAAAEDLSDEARVIKPSVHESDAVLGIRSRAGDEFVLIFEVLRKPAEEKLRHWVRYVADVHDRCKVPVVLVVICNDRSTAKWASRPIRIGTDFWPSCVVSPLVLGPHNVRIPEGPIGEANLAPTHLGVIAHGKDPCVVGVLEPLAATLYELDEDRRVRIALEIQLALLEPTAARVWRNLTGFVTIDPDVMRSHPLLGDIIWAVETRGRAKGLLNLLEEREIRLTDLQRERILAVHDRELLRGWLRAAMLIGDADELFE